MYCKNCGKKLKETEKYCSNCGVKVITEKSRTTTKDSSALVIAILALVSVWLPLISIPLSIISIVLVKKQKDQPNDKKATLYLGTISLILSFCVILVATIFTINFINLASDFSEGNIQLPSIYDYDYDYSTSQSFDISGYSWKKDDNSVLYLNKDNTYSLYQDDQVHTDNFQSGKYTFYTGNDAIEYIANKLKQYGLTEEQQEKIFENSAYQLKDYYLLILDSNKNVTEGKEETTTKSLYYYGFYDENNEKLILINIDNKEQVVFTKLKKLSSIDV